MKWMNKEGTKKDDLPEGSVYQDKKGGSYTEHRPLHMQLDHQPTLDPLQEDDLSGERMDDSGSEKSSDDGVRASENGDDDETFEDGGNVKGVESGKKSGDDDNSNERVEGEECNLLEQYFSKKQNPAKKKFHHLLRKASKEANVYGKKRLSKIPPPAKKYIYDRVCSSCPEISGHEEKFDVVLSRVLTQAKYYRKHHPDMSPKKNPVKGTKKNSPFKNIVKGKKLKRTTVKNDKKSEGTRQEKTMYELKCLAKRQTAERVKQALLKFQSGSGGCSSYKPGDEVVVTHRGKEIGKAIFIEKQDDMFAELSFSLKKIDVNDDINLYKPVAANEELQRNEKLTFGQLEANDLFVWKIGRIKAVSRKATESRLRTQEQLKSVDRLM